MLGKVQELHLMGRLGKARRTACLRKRIGKDLHQKLEEWEFAQHRVFILVYVLYAKEISSESGVYQAKDKS